MKPVFEKVERVNERVEDLAKDQVRKVVDWQVRGAVEIQVWRQIDRQVRWLVEGQVVDQVERQVWEQVEREVIKDLTIWSNLVRIIKLMGKWFPIKLYERN